MDSQKALVIFSGGQDSTTCLFWAIENFDDVEAIGFDYGQRHLAELEAATKIAEITKIPYQKFKIDTLSDISKNSLTSKEIEIKTPPNDHTPPNTLVEGRNLLFILYAAIYAKSKNIRHLVLGVGQTDYSGYPDCRDSFIKSANVTVNLAFDFEFVIHTPLMWKTKAETWQMADNMGALDLIKNNTVTCYNGIIGKGCGTCPSCILRQKGLEEYLSFKYDNNVN
jgi:7-cyano-7-deazaguanine synthase